MKQRTFDRIKIIISLLLVLVLFVFRIERREKYYHFKTTLKACIHKLFHTQKNSLLCSISHFLITVLTHYVDYLNKLLCTNA